MRDINLNGAARRTDPPAIVIHLDGMQPVAPSLSSRFEEKLRRKLTDAGQVLLKAGKVVGKYLLAWTVFIGFIMGVRALWPFVKELFS